jgi:hypothetical protein
VDNRPNAKLVMIVRIEEFLAALRARFVASDYPEFGHSDWPDSKEFA